MTEKPFENKIKQWLKESDCWFVKYWGGGTFTRAGVPDLICCIAGHFVAIEVKGDKGKPSELQKANIRKIKKSGGIGLIAYPNDWENIKAYLTALLRGKEDEAKSQQD